MRAHLLVAMTLLLVACGSSEEPANDTQGVQTQNSTSNTFSTGVPGQGNNGPTGNNDPVDPTTLPGYTPPPPGQPTPVPTPGPSLTEYCGIAFKSFYDDVIRRYIDQNTNRSAHQI